MIVRNNVKVSFTTTLVLDEDQVGALDALVGYGFDSFVKVFYEKLGKAYMEPHEDGLRRLFEAIETQVRPAKHTIQEARRTIKESIK